jgi:hypothetical protein
MEILPFEALFGELAVRETRVIAVVESASVGYPKRVPVDEYGFDEWYCTDPDCDCRRVVFFVMSANANGHVATIEHFFEPPGRHSRMPAQTFLDPFLPQTELAPALLELCKDTLLADSGYCRRLERHYRMVKDAFADPDHPCHRIVRDLEREQEREDSRSRAAFPRKRRGKRRWQ